MSAKSIILLLMALGCGLVAAVGINQIMARPAGETETVAVVVAKREIKKGDPLKPDDIRLQEWPKDTVPEGALDSIEKLQDRFTRFNIVPGEPILDSKLYAKGDNIGINTEIPPGMKAVWVKVDNVSGGAGLILPGDNVDVIVHMEANTGKGIMQTTTKPLLKNIKVLAVDDVLERPAPGEPSIPAKTVALLVTNKQAALVTHATNIGEVRLVMRSAKGGDEDDEPDVVVTTGDILSGSTSAGETGPSSAGGGIVPLPPVEAKSPSVGEQVKDGLTGLGALLKELKDARDGGVNEPKEKPFTVVLIEGPETREIEFDGKSRIGKPAGSDMKPAGSDAPEPALPLAPDGDTTEGSSGAKPDADAKVDS